MHVLLIQAEALSRAILLVIVFPLLKMIASDHFEFADRVIFLPLEEVYLLQEFLFVVLELTHG